MSNYNKGIYLCLITAFISGASIFINKFGLKGLDPFVFTGAKNMLVAITLFSLILLAGERKTFKKLKRKDWFNLLFIGFIGGSLPFLLFFKGLSLTSAFQASFIHKNLFLLVAFLTPFFLQEKVEKNFFIAALLLLIGNFFLLNKAFPLQFNKGNLLIFLAVVFWALENVIAKKILFYLPAKIVAFGRMAFGSFFILLFLTFTQRAPLLTVLTIKEILWILLTGGFLLGYVLTWYQGLKYIPVTTAASILTLGAPITTILSLFYGQTLSTKDFFGLAFIFSGILVLIKLQKSLLSLVKIQRSLKLKSR